MTTDLLFDVPKNKTRLELCKEQHGIETRDNGPHVKPEQRWQATTKTAPFWYLGATEVEAVIALCAQNKIEVIL